MKRPTLRICTRCENDDARGDGHAFFKALKAARKAQGLKPWFRLEESGCQGGCDTPCNAQVVTKKRDPINRTWLDAHDDVQPLLEAVKRFALSGEASDFPGRPG